MPERGSVPGVRQFGGSPEEELSSSHKALTQSFASKELVHLYQAQLKTCKKKTEVSMVDLGRDVAKLVRLAYPTADAATRGVISINSFLEGLPGPASEIKLHVIKGRPCTLQ